MSEEEERPFCQRSAAQTTATTYNVNLYTCASLVPGFAVHFVDYEVGGPAAEPSF